LLADPWLEDNAYYSNNVYANVIEVLGCLTLSMVLCIAFTIFALNTNKCRTRYAKIILTISFYVISLSILTYEIGYECLSILASIVLNKVAVTTSQTWMIYMISLCFASIIQFLAWYWLNKRLAITLTQLLKWALIVVIVIVAGYFIIGFLKNTMYRERYRAIHYYGGSIADFSPWYALTWHPHAPTELSNWKSFPSSHTEYAASVYGFALLPLFLPKTFNKRRIRVILWVSTITFTGLVAFGRILAGAHYLSDTFFGGTIVFLLYMITTWATNKSFTFKIQTDQYYVNNNRFIIYVAVTLFLGIALFTGMQFELC
jgi:membrane-associated phospholipid phosphatase